MYRERLEKDGVHHLLWPSEPGIADSPASAVGVGATADGPSKAPCAPSERRERASAVAVPAVTAVTTSRGPPGTQHFELRNNQERGGGVGGGGGKNGDNVTTAPASAVTPSPSSAALVPRGAYRRLLCVPACVSWEAAAPWNGSATGDAGGSPAEDSSAPRVCTERASVALVAADSEGGSGGDGDGGEGGGRSGGRNEPGDPPMEGREGERTVSSVNAVLPPVLDDVCLAFTLPPGSFATMFLREVMKTDHDVAWGVPAAGGKEEGGEGLVEAIGADRK